MLKHFTGALLSADPQVHIFDGAAAEDIARRHCMLDHLRDRVDTEAARTGTTQRIISTWIRGSEFVAAIYWGGFEDPEENGLLCCVGRCTEPEHFPIVLRMLADFLSHAIRPSPFNVN